MSCAFFPGEGLVEGWYNSERVLCVLAAAADEIADSSFKSSES